METTLHTLHEFSVLTKGVGYIVAGLLLVSFVPFWKYLTQREKDD